MVAILEKLEAGAIVSKEASQEMISILKRCQDSSGIRRRLGQMSIANKSGALDALRSDVGIVYARGGRIAIAITVDGMAVTDYSPDNPGSLLIADLAKILVEGLSKQAAPVSFQAEVQPILSKRCQACHSEALRSGGVSVATHASLAKAISLLPGAIGGEKPRMPKAGAPLTPAEVATIQRWIEEGGKDDSVVGKKQDRWWSLRPLVKAQAGASIDSFVSKAGSERP
ncbi:MAG: serine hydrolase [Bryobacteraceae bacterium]